MRKRPALALAALLAALVLATAGCSAPDAASDAEPTSTWSSGSQAETPATPDATDAEVADEQPAQQEDVSHGLPHRGMSAELIDATWLGAHDDTGDVVQGGQLTGCVPYNWRAQNGTGDMVFAAYVRDGEVIRVSKFNMGTDYWIDAGRRSRALPDRAASGAQAASGGAGWSPSEDPQDYGSPEEYADNAQGEFAAHGSADPWNEAYNYWEDND